MLRLMDRVNTIATSHAPVLIRGESGTGKELVARALHERGPRRGNAFVAVNCAAFPDTLLEAELFGHERGAFTGAVRRRDGRFRAAHGGTLLLDEVAEMSLPAQAKLLRVLQEGTIEPLGTNESLRVDVRVISATHRDLKERIADGRFREDLYYRLNVLDVDIPPLRDRRGDLPLLVQYFLKKFTRPGRDLPNALTGRLERRCRSSPSPATSASWGTPSSTPPCWPTARTSTSATCRATSRGPARWPIGTTAPPAPARHRAQGVRARVPSARAGAGRRQAHGGRRDPGHLPQEPVGEAPDARLQRLSSGTLEGFPRPPATDSVGKADYVHAIDLARRAAARAALDLGRRTGRPVGQRHRVAGQQIAEHAGHHDQR